MSDTRKQVMDGRTDIDRTGAVAAAETKWPSYVVTGWSRG